MNENKPESTSRRQFLSAASASALAGIALPPVHAAENNTIQLALVGCGGRGTGAAIDALSVSGAPVKLVAMADVVPKKMSDSYDKLKTQFAAQVDVPPDRRFLGFDAYRQAMDSVKAGDVVILGTPPAFRWVQFTYAIDKGLNTFMDDRCRAASRLPSKVSSGRRAVKISRPGLDRSEGLSTGSD